MGMLFHGGGGGGGTSFFFFLGKIGVVWDSPLFEIGRKWFFFQSENKEQ